MILAGFVVLSSALVSVCNLSQVSAAATQIIDFIFRLLFILYYSLDILSEKIFTNCLVSFISILSDQITYTIGLFVTAGKLMSFDFLGDNRILSTLLYLVMEGILMILFLLVLKDISCLPKRINSFLVIMTAAALVVSTFFLNIIVEIDTDTLPMNYRIQLNVISILILGLFLAMLFLIQFISGTYQKNIELTNQVHIHEINAERNKSLLQSVESLQKWKHDYNNHLIAMQGLLAKESYEQLQQYVADQQENLPKFLVTINTGHSVMDAILTSKYAAAQSNRIRFTYSVILPEKFPISDTDLTGVLGNLLDNALEASKRVIDVGGSPYIELSIKPKRNMLYIFIENRTVGNYHYNKEGELETSKKGKKLHGKGLKNVMAIVENYSGFCKIQAKPDSFSINVYIPLP
jgi:signal transduction histidine kinase